MSLMINRRDLDFMLYELLDIEALCQRPRFCDHGRDTFDPLLDTAESIARDYFEPHAAKADEHEPTFDGERVHLVEEVKPALEAFFAAGFGGATQDFELGGMQLPETLYSACHFIFNCANVGTAGYPFLTVAAANLISAHGSDEQRERYMKPMMTGRYFGTMCLSEPQAGSSLADIRTRAVPQVDGSFHIVGNKMWISGGEHDLSDNIIHMVLAKIPDGPPGVKGISLFIVPKYRVDEHGICGERNDVQLAGLNHKMGFRGTTNTLLNFGENDRCVGYLVGEAHRGLGYMFHMMNEARIGVGMTATALGYAGYRYSLEYARERPQGRLPSAKDPTSPQVPIIEHTDVRRMLLMQKAYTEGALALCLYCSSLVDEKNTADSAQARDKAHLLLEVLTPVAKAWPSEWCLEANKWAIQILGGYGYTRDYPVERLYRDNRLNMIHEGTNGIQGIDLLGRKVVMNGGAAFALLMSEIQTSADVAANSPDLADWVRELNQRRVMVEDVTRHLASTAAEKHIDLFLANSAAYLEMMGHLVVAWLWLRQALVAETHLETCTPSERDFYQGKLQACRYYFRWELPKLDLLATRLKELDRTFLDAQSSQF